MKDAASKSRHRDHRLAKRARVPLVVTTPPPYTVTNLISPESESEPTKHPPPSNTSSFIPDVVLNERMDHLLQKNYTKTDPLTMSNAKAKEYINNVVVAQEQIFDRATKLDTHINAGFADFEVRCVTLFASLPSQKKASKSSQITFLCNLYFIIIIKLSNIFTFYQIQHPVFILRIY